MNHQNTPTKRQRQPAVLPPLEGHQSGAPTSSSGTSSTPAASDASSSAPEDLSCPPRESQTSVGSPRVCRPVPPLASQAFRAAAQGLGRTFPDSGDLAAPRDAEPALRSWLGRLESPVGPIQGPDWIRWISTWPPNHWNDQAEEIFWSHLERATYPSRPLPDGNDPPPTVGSPPLRFAAQSSSTPEPSEEAFAAAAEFGARLDPGQLVSLPTRQW